MLIPAVVVLALPLPSWIRESFPFRLGGQAETLGAASKLFRAEKVGIIPVHRLRATAVIII